MSELVDAFLKHKGFKKEKGGTNAPLMPNLLADSLYLCWDEFLKDKLSKSSKMYANRMMIHYPKFNKEFFAGFNKLQSSICIDAMDRFSEFTENELNLFRIATRNRFPNTDIEKKYMIAQIHVCKLLAAQADGIWSIIYRNRYGGRDYDVNLQGMYVSARELLDTYQKENLPCFLSAADSPSRPFYPHPLGTGCRS